MIDFTNRDWLTRAMEQADVATGELAALSGVSRSQIQRIRRGMQPRMGTLIAIKNALEPRIGRAKAAA